MKLTRLSENLYSLRKKRGLSQEEFAEKIHISRQAVSKWERGEAYPDTENLIEIAAFYGVTLDELVNAEDITERTEREPSSDGKPDDGCADTADGSDGESACKGEGEGIEFAISPDDEDDDDFDEDFDDDFDEDFDDGEGESKLKVEFGFKWEELPSAVIVTVAYLLLGFLTPRGWEIWWTLYLTVPIISSIFVCVRTRRVSAFAYPVLCAFLYLLFGMIKGIWHPTWIIFVTVPIFEAIAAIIDRRRAKKGK